MIRVELVVNATTYYFSDSPLDYADKYWEPKIVNGVSLNRIFSDTEKSGSQARSLNLKLDNRDNFFTTLEDTYGLLNQIVTVYFGAGDTASKKLYGTIEKINSFGLEVDITITESILPYLAQPIPDEQIAYDYYSDMGINDSWDAVPIIFGTARRHKLIPFDYVYHRYGIGSGEIYKVHKVYFDTEIIYDGDANPVVNGYSPDINSNGIKVRIFKGKGWGGSLETVTDEFGSHTSVYPGMAYIEFYDAVTGDPVKPQMTDNTDPEVFVDVSGIVNSGRTDAERNPAQLAYWLLTNPTTARNISGGGPNGWGLGIPVSLVDCTQAIIDSAALGFKVDGIINTRQEGREWVDELAKSCRGIFTEENGKYTLSIDKARGASVATFDETGENGYHCIVEPWNEPDLSQQINRLKVEFGRNHETGKYDKIPDPASIYTENSTHALRINKWNNDKIELPLVQDEVTAARLGQYYFKKKLNQLKTVTVTTEVDIPDALDVGKVVLVNAPKFLWTYKSFTVVEMSKSDTKTVLKLKEYDATVYDYTAISITYPTPVVPPSMYAIPAKPTNFNVTASASIRTDGTTQVTLNLTATKPTSNAQYVVFFRKKVGDANFEYFTQMATSGTHSYIWDKESGNYYIRAVTLSPTGVYSPIAISAGDTHYKGQPGAETYLTITGDLSAPGLPTVTAQSIINGASLLINITGGIPADFNHFSVERAIAVDGAPDLANITVLNDHVKTQLYSDIQPDNAYSCWFYRVKAFDNSNNASAYSSWSSMVVPMKIDTKDIVAGAITSETITSQQIVGKDIRTACNAGNGCVSGIKITSSGIEGWNGAVKNFQLDSATGALTAQNACISGNITATTGNIGGWCVEANRLYSGNVGMQSYTCNGCVSFYAGCSTPTCAPFRVTNEGLLVASNACISGTITATSGSFTGALHAGTGDIAGWTINTDNLSGSTAGKGSVSLYKSGYIGIYRCETQSCYGSVTLGNCLRLAGGWSNLYNGISIIKNGSVDVFSAYTRLSDNCFIGKIAGWTFTDTYLCSNNIVLNSTGSLYTADFVSGLRGWCVSCFGSAEFNNVIVRGELRSSVFAYDEITAIGGQMLVAEAGLLASCWTTPALNACNAMCVKNSPAGTGIVFAANDIIRVKTYSSNGVRDAWAKVISATICTGYYLYCVQLVGGSASSVIPAAVAVANYGPANDTSGAILLNGQGSNSPYIDVFTNGKCPWVSLTPRVRIGNLTGIAGASGYGLWTNNGNIYGGLLQSSNWGDNCGTCIDLTTGIIKLGGDCNPNLYFDGCDLVLKGTICATAGTFGGALCSCSGCIAAFNINACGIYSCNANSYFCINNTGIDMYICTNYSGSMYQIGKSEFTNASGEQQLFLCRVYYPTSDSACGLFYHYCALLYPSSINFSSCCYCMLCCTCLCYCCINGVCSSSISDGFISTIDRKKLPYIDQSCCEATMWRGHLWLYTTAGSNANSFYCSHCIWWCCAGVTRMCLDNCGLYWEKANPSICASGVICIPNGICGTIYGGSCYVYYQDIRNCVLLPYHCPAGIYLFFITNTCAGLSDGGAYSGIMTVRKYGSTCDMSGGLPMQLGFTDNGNVWMRIACNCNTWNTWYRIAKYDGNLTSNYNTTKCVEYGNETTIAYGYCSTGALYINYRGSIGSCPITDYYFYNGVCSGYANIHAKGFSVCIGYNVSNIMDGIITTAYICNTTYCINCMSKNGFCGYNTLTTCSACIKFDYSINRAYACGQFELKNSLLCFACANPYICASSYTVFPGGLYVSGGTFYAANTLMARGGIKNDNTAVLYLCGGCTGECTYVYGCLQVQDIFFSPDIYISNNRITQADDCGLYIRSGNCSYAYHRFYSCQGCVLGSIYGTTSNAFGILDCAGSWMIGGSTTATWICNHLTVYGHNCTCISCCNGYAMFVCNTGSSGCGILSISTTVAVYGWACNGLCGVAGRSSKCYGVHGYAYNDYGVLGYACYCYGVYGSVGSAYPVAGNGAYYNASTRTLKSGFEEVEVLPSLRCLCITKWSWMDTNQTTHDEFIGPVAEDVQQAFKLTFANDGIYQLDGIALKAAQELDTCVTDLKACICSLTDCINNRLSALEAKLQ